MASGTKLVQRFFWVIMMIIAVMFSVVYVYSVPLIQKEVYEIERNSARLALNNVFQLTNKMYSNLESFRTQALEAHKQRLKVVVELTESQLTHALTQLKADQDQLGFEAERSRLFEALQEIQYGNDGYIWIAAHDTTLLSLPDPRFQGVEVAATENHEQSSIIRGVIDSAVRDGEGFYQYKWQRLNEGPLSDKISYVKNIPQWGFVIGSGLYLDDLDTEVQARKQTAIQEVRDALSEIQIAKTGYLYIFDQSGHLLAHPNENIDQTNAQSLINPSSGRSIIKELIEIADTGKELHYKWDSPSDPGNYIYDKISLVRSMEGFGWYICSSVYVDELRHSSVALSQRILTIAFVSILLAITLALFFINRIVQPIKRLSHTAIQVRNGDLTARSGIQRDDELGILANTFDSMIQQLHSSIQHLDIKVNERTLELTQLEERQRMILDALPAQIAYLDVDMSYIFVNQRYADLFGGDKASIVGKTIDEIIDPKMKDSIKPQIDKCLQGEEVVYEYNFQREGREIITKRILLPYESSAGNIVGVLNLSLDITAEKEAEQRLTEAQRMSAAGQLAGGLAHDFNNLLTIIQGNLLSAEERFSSVEGLEKYLSPAIRASRRGADITTRLLAFSRRQPLAPTAIEVKSLIEETIELITPSLPGSIIIRNQIESDSVLFVDPVQLENTLVNLILNARDAMPGGGSIKLLVRDLHLESTLNFDEPVPAGDYIEIRVSDTGSGFSNQALSQAFEPFFTTKGVGKGTGLGLSMVYGFIKQSQGYIDIVNQTQGGASVTLLLPLPAIAITDNEQCESLSHAVIQKGSQSKLILLVEDDRDVRSVVREQLVDLGYTVLEAGDADEAAQLIESLSEIDGLVTDIDMPGRLDGFGLADLMRKQKPDSTIVLISGNAAYQRSTYGQQYWDILQKPFSREELDNAISNPSHS